MIFTRTKSNADAVSKYIDRKELGPVRVVHSNKSQNTRINAVNEFKEGGLRVLVTTDVTARGIDVTNVSHVINFDVPPYMKTTFTGLEERGERFRKEKRSPCHESRRISYRKN
jgi:ATP-dependent RNA helicase RhlE